MVSTVPVASPQSWTYDKFAHLTTMPLHGWDAVTVPGAVAVWVALSRRFGRLPFADLFEPAIGYATHGFPVPPKIAAAWKLAEDRYRDFAEFCRVFLPKGRAPHSGELFANADQAATLREIAVSQGESFYRGGPWPRGLPIVPKSRVAKCRPMILLHTRRVGRTTGCRISRNSPA